MVEKIKNLKKEYKSELISFGILLFVALILGVDWFLLTFIIEIGFLVKWELDRKKGKERSKFSIREKGLFIGLIFMVFVIVCTTAESINTENELNGEIDELKVNYESKIDTLEEENKDLKNENEELQLKVDEASPWFEMKEEERKAEEERLQKEKEEKERKEQEEKEKKEKQGYNTGITYNQLARTPDEYEGEKVKFSGKVLQFSEGWLYDVVRLAVGGNYDNVLYLTVPKSITEDERILEDDYVTIYGVSEGIETYTTVMGASMSIPSVSVDKIDR